MDSDNNGFVFANSDAPGVKNPQLLLGIGTRDNNQPAPTLPIVPTTIGQFSMRYGGGANPSVIYSGFPFTCGRSVYFGIDGRSSVLGSGNFVAFSSE